MVELLAVIAIIGILASILISVVGMLRQSAKRSTCISNERQILTAALLYASDNNGVLPRTYDRGSGTVVKNPSTAMNAKGLIDLLDPYIRGAAVDKSKEPYSGQERRSYYCPDVTRTDGKSTNPWNYDYQFTRTDGEPFLNLGYWWLNSNTAADAVPAPQTVANGSSKRILITCNTINAYYGNHNRNINMGFVDGSVQAFKSKSIAQGSIQLSNGGTVPALEMKP